ncbi:17-beta-hydroxysteroid dehydrogenase 14 isoform X3 [Podarcis raffonei]|uniref:17-beta-hydroxysteroid dehydrogenase 14 isoform X3 n=1 Tax=Podarcis raffonei TaxID=65483 RepID=UPI00232915CA|nr:17-beta-hydroxysteroid dehydrogenase 14 isoform X3 [Podarcis raffonei]
MPGDTEHAQWAKTHVAATASKVQLDVRDLEEPRQHLEWQLDCVRHGAKVVFCAPGSEGERGKVIEKELNDSAGPGEGHFEVCDVLRETDIKTLVSVTVELYGQLDCLVNNAGGHPPDQTIDDVSAQEFRSLMDLNVVSCFLAAKGAVTAMTKAMAIDESKYGVRVNSISPGNIWTPMWEKLASQTADPEATIQEGIDAQLLGRMGTPAECAAAALYLASEATFCTGINLVLSGGAELGYAQKSHRELNPSLED